MSCNARLCSRGAGLWLALALLLATSVSNVDARMQLLHRRDLLHHKRQGIVVSPTPSEGASSTPAGNGAAPSSTPGGLLGTLIGGGGDVQTSSSVSVDVPLPVSTSSTPASSSVAASSSAPSSSVRSRASSSVELESSASITSTQSIEPSTSSAPDTKGDDKPMGIAKKTIIIIASVAGSVGLVAAIWTILRKTKFSPSRKFERRLNPIDWTPEDDANLDNRHAPDALMHRAGSDDSLSLKRGNSFGSNSGSQRGGQMTEVGYGASGSQYGGSAAGIGAYNGAVPGYPPSHSMRGGYVPEHQRPYPTGSQYTLGNSYEQVTRQAAPIHGGRYGESYGQAHQF